MKQTNTANTAASIHTDPPTQLASYLSIHGLCADIHKPCICSCLSYLEIYSCTRLLTCLLARARVRGDLFVNRGKVATANRVQDHVGRNARPKSTRQAMPPSYRFRG